MRLKRVSLRRRLCHLSDGCIAHAFGYQIRAGTVVAMLCVRVFIYFLMMCGAESFTETSG